MSLPTLAALPLVPAVLAHPTLLRAIGGVIGLFVVTLLYLYPYRAWALTYKALPGPNPTHWFWGNFKDIVNADPSEAHMKWIETNGPTLRYHLFLGSHRFFTADPVAVGFMLNHGDDFVKPAPARRQMADLLGDGVLTAEGDVHRRQRRVLNPSFSPAAIREMQPIFYDKAYELRDKLAAMIEDDAFARAVGAAPTPAADIDTLPGARKVNVTKFLAQATIDVIGIAGFNYDFAALAQKDSELADAFHKMLQAGQEVSLEVLIQAFVPGTRWIPTKSMRAIWAGQEVSRRIGKRLIDEKKRAVLAANAGELEKGTDIGKDLLSIVVRANMAADLRPDQKLTDDEMLAQITTFMFAGNETSGTALTWILYCLSQHPDVQTRLRAELAAVPTDRPSNEELSALPYLEHVIREVLRLYAPAPGTVRCTTREIVLPLGTPVKGRDGKMLDSVTLPKGQTVFIPILCMHQLESIWGEDAAEFNPDRWAKLPAETAQIPGVWGNLLTFLGGSHNCIGYRFALAEIRAILFVLVRNFTFDELASKPQIERKTAVVMRPRVVTEKECGPQMPLLVRPVAGDN
ncbi:hypothetical protein Q5752_001130 [Cryptotrichosporon argae]